MDAVSLELNYKAKSWLEKHKCIDKCLEIIFQVCYPIYNLHTSTNNNEINILLILFYESIL